MEKVILNENTKKAVKTITTTKTREQELKEQLLQEQEKNNTLAKTIGELTTKYADLKKAYRDYKENDINDFADMVKLRTARPFGDIISEIATLIANQIDITGTTAILRLEIDTNEASPYGKNYPYIVEMLHRNGIFNKIALLKQGGQNHLWKCYTGIKQLMLAKKTAINNLQEGNNLLASNWNKIFWACESLQAQTQPIKIERENLQNTAQAEYINYDANEE